MMKPEIFKMSKTADIRTDRLVMQRIKTDYMDLLVGSVYMPTDGNILKFQEMCSTIIKEVTRLREEHTEILLIGDMNIREGHKPKRKAMFSSMIETLGLRLHTPKTYTNMSRNKNKTRTILDYIIATPGIEVGEIDVYHLDRLPDNSSTHSPIFATVKIPMSDFTEEEKQEIVEDAMTSPFSNYLARKRPNWNNMDKDLFHKLVRTKTKAIWPDIGEQPPDLRLNSLITILVRSALDASASIPETTFSHEEQDMKNLSEKIRTISKRIKKLTAKDGKTR